MFVFSGSLITWIKMPNGIFIYLIKIVKNKIDNPIIIKRWFSHIIMNQMVVESFPYNYWILKYLAKCKKSLFFIYVNCDI
jgi:hypothetical protein